MRYWEGYYPKYVSVGEKRAKAVKNLEKLKKKNPDIQPVIIEGKKLASTWWGNAWNTNLERYADYSNRIERGRSYVRHGAVLDLKILSGEVRALVQGSQANPYSIVIRIKEIDQKIWREIRTACEGKLESLSELLMGKFPKELQEVFMAKGVGLFPSPGEIKFECSCPDWAYMCKHVAATLYGVGARLDEDPSLFFKLRKVDMNDLITQAVKEKTQKLLKKAETKSSRVMENSDISEVFGIEIDEPAKVKSKEISAIASGKEKISKAVSSRNKAEAKIEEIPAKASGTQKISKVIVTRNNAEVKQSPKTEDNTKGLTITDMVMKAVRRSRKGLTAEEISKKIGLDEKQVQSALYRAKYQGKIKVGEKGIYTKI